MDIAAASISMSMNNVQNQASISVMKKAMDQTEQSAQAMLEAMEAMPAPLPPGRRLDMYI